MKKLISIALTAFIILSLFVGTIYSEEEKTLDESIDEILTGINTNIYDVDVIKTDVKGCINEIKKSNETYIAIDKHYYETMALVTSVDYTDWDKYNYEWSFSNNPRRFVQHLNGISSTWPIYIVDKLPYKQLSAFFRCTATNKENPEDIKTVTYVVNVRRDEKVKYDYILFLGINNIGKNGMLDLDSLGIGNGKVSLNEDGSVINLDNINYTFDPEELYGDIRFCPATGLNYFQIMNKNKNVTINLIGDNTITNKYYSDNSDGNGYGYDLTASYLGDADEKYVTYEITGDGTLNTIGGSGAIWLKGDAYINSNINYISNNTQKTNGIYACKTTFGPNANVVMNDVSQAIYAVGDYLGKQVENDVILEKGSKLELNALSYISNTAPSMAYGILTSGNIIIDGAKLDINLYTDINIYDEEDYNQYGCFGMSISNRNNTKDITITDSDVNITYDNNIEETDEYHILNRVYGISDAYPYIADEGLSKLIIDNSNVTIDVQGKVSEVCALRSKDFTIADSNLDININCNTNELESLIGINMIRNNFPKDEQLSIKDSKVNINIDSDIQKDTVGIVFDYLDIDLKDENYYVNIDTNGNGQALLSYLDCGEVERTYEEDYEGKKILLIGNSILPNKEKANICSFDRSIGFKSFEEHSYYYYETLYKNKKPVSKLLVTGHTDKPTPTPDPKPKPTPVPYVAPKTGIN